MTKRRNKVRKLDSNIGDRPNSEEGHRRISKRVVENAKKKADKIQAQTESHPINTIHVAGIPREIQLAKLREHFEELVGSVKTCKFVDCKPGTSINNELLFNSAFITFKQVHIFQRSLRQINVLRGQQLEISDANSKKSATSFKAIDDTLNFEHNLTNPFLSLNDDCLMHIYSFLPPKDVFIMGKVCQRLSYISVRCCRKYEFFEVNRMNYQKFEREIFKEIGEYIKCLHFDLIRSLKHLKEYCILEMLSKYCVNLTSLKLECFKLGDFCDFTGILRYFPKLESFQLVDCQGMDDTFKGSTLVKSNNLKTLEIISNKKFSGIWLHYLFELDSLTLTKCFSLRLENVLTCLKNNPQLRSLCLMHNLLFDFVVSCMPILASMVPNLEELTIFYPSFTLLQDAYAGQFSLLPKLKKLHLYKPNNVELEITLRSLIELNILEELNLSGDHTLDNINLNLLCKLTKLKVLRFSANCPKSVQVTKLIEKFPFRHLQELLCDGSVFQKVIVDLIRQATKLNTLRVYNSWDFKMNHLNSIIDLMEGNSQRPRLDIYLDFDDVLNDVKNRQLLAQKRSIVRVFKDPNQLNKFFKHDQN